MLCSYSSNIISENWIAQLLFTNNVHGYKWFVMNITILSWCLICKLLSKWSISYILCKFYGGWFLLKYFLIHLVFLCFCDGIFRLTSISY